MSDQQPFPADPGPGGSKAALVVELIATAIALALGVVIAIRAALG